MDRADEKAKAARAVPIRHEPAPSWSYWHKASEAGPADCPLCGRPGGTSFADDTWICCLPVSPLPFFY